VTVAVLAALATGCALLPRKPAAPPAPLAPQPPPANPQPRPTLNVNANYVTNVDRPWDIAFDPVGAHDLVFTENNTGKVRAFYGGSVHDVGNMGGLSGATFDNTGEGGLMGLAFNPSGSALLLCVTTNVDNRVVRMSVTRDVAGHPTSLGAPANIVTGMAHAGFHNGCRVRFQPNSSPPALWVTMGDAGGGPNPQNPGSLNGKILRIRENGLVYPGNNSGARWYSKGHRNPQGIAFHPLLNVPYDAEHGPDKDDEVNLLSNGGNAGWDPNTNGAYDQSHPMTDLAKFPNATRPLWRSGTPTNLVTYAPSGITFVTGAQWHAWNGALMVAFLKNSELRVLFFDGFAKIIGQLTLPESHLGKRLRVPVENPYDGAVYVATDHDFPTTIWRITAS